MDLHQIKLEILKSLFVELCLANNMDEIIRINKIIERLDHSIELDYSLNVY